MNIKLSENIRLELSNNVSHDGKLEIKNVNINNVKYAIGYTLDKTRDFRKYVEARLKIQLELEIEKYLISNEDSSKIYDDVKFYDIPKRPSEIIENHYIQVSYEKIMQGIVIIYKSTDNYYSHRSEQNKYIEYDLINGTFNSSVLYKIIPIYELNQMLIMHKYSIGKINKPYEELIDLLKWFKRGGKKSVWVIKEDGSKFKTDSLYTQYLNRIDIEKVEYFRYKNENFYVNPVMKQAIPS